MITKVDSLATIETERHYIVVPADPFRAIEENVERFADFHGASRVPEGFAYTSDGNDEWLSVEELRRLIHDRIDASVPLPSRPASS